MLSTFDYAHYSLKMWERRRVVLIFWYSIVLIMYLYVEESMFKYTYIEEICYEKE